jgi:tetratricopeptide (TPR) repeat protein
MINVFSSKDGAWRLFPVIFLCLALIPARAQTRNDWWFTLEQGKQDFRESAYGSAFIHFDNARRQRRAMYEQMERDLIDLLSLTPVRRMGDSLDRIDSYARERRYDRAAAALDEAYYRFSKTEFNNSAQAVLIAIGGLKNYPEAEYWIGETYRLEGELSLAVAQYQKAWEQREFLEQKGFETELLYKIANIRRIRQEYNEMERTLLRILAQDELWAMGDTGTVSVLTSESGAINAFARNAMTKTLETEGINRFLAMYRYANTAVEQAHRLLGLFYYSTGRHYPKSQEHLMYAFLIQNSIIIEEVIRNEYGFSFTHLDALASRINRYPLIAEYVDTVEYYKTAYYLGCSLYGNGKTAAARGLWSFLSAYAPTGEWRTRARSQLRQFQPDRAIEMP